MASRAFGFISSQMTRGDRLGHSWREGRLLFPGLACDFACMIRAALALYEATGERAYLDQALAWQRALDRHYANPDNGGYFLTADDAEGLVVRPGATTDDATPNPNAIAAGNLVRLAALAGDDAWRAKADRLFEGVLGAAGENLIGHAALLNALDLRLRGAEIVVTGSGAQADALAAAALRLPTLNRIVLRAPNADALPASHPARDKIAAAPRGRGVRVRRRAMLAAGDGTASASPQAVARDGRSYHSDSKLESLCAPRRSRIRSALGRNIMRLLPRRHAGCMTDRHASRLAEDMQVELNALENTENRCRMTFVIENKGKAAVDSLKLDLALFNTDGAVYRRMVVDMAPVRAAKTIVEGLRDRGDCAQLGKVLVNEVTACTPGDAAACQDQLALSSRVKTRAAVQVIVARMERGEVRTISHD